MKVSSPESELLFICSCESLGSAAACILQRSRSNFHDATLLREIPSIPHEPRQKYENQISNTQATNEFKQTRPYCIDLTHTNLICMLITAGLPNICTHFKPTFAAKWLLTRLAVTQIRLLAAVLSLSERWMPPMVLLLSCRRARPGNQP